MKSQQIGNYVSNGSFEEILNGSNPLIATGWSSTDSSSSYAGEILTGIDVPLSGWTYQQAIHGDSYLISTLFCTTCSYNTRSYPKNRLRANLKSGKTYCVSFYVNLMNRSSYAISSIGAYFGDASIDTISYCTIPLTYLIPQIQNSVGNYLSDTLNWMQVKGFYTATGAEKYLLLGNFNNDANSDSIFVNPQILPARGCSYLIEDVSCIEVDLVAYAGRDTTVTPGTPVFLGREPDFAIDPGCTWYQWPNMSAPIYDKAGLWVNPVVTTTYIVKQILDCSPEKWDTVVITVDPTIVNVSSDNSNGYGDDGNIQIFPNPANEYLELEIRNAALEASIRRLRIYNSLGQLIREQDYNVKIRTEDLAGGVYFLQLVSPSTTLRRITLLNKGFVIAR